MIGARAESPADPSTPSIDSLLEGSSRTFALALPLLPEPIRREASVAYLLLRVADTLEDAVSWSAAARAEALAALSRFLETPTPQRAGELAGAWLRRSPCEERGYIKLLEAFPQVIERLVELDPAAREVVVGHARRTAAGMSEYALLGAGGRLSLSTMEELRGYCYVVAGIVGELMTALFILPPASVDPSMAAALSLRARSFGEGLQLVNILRDERADRSLGRRLIPPRGHARAVKLAWKDLVVAAEYTAILREGNAPAGVVAFAVFLTRLAKGTLDLVVRDGPGAKLSRAEVRAALAGLPVDHQSSRRDWR